MARVFQSIFALSLFLFLSCFINHAVARTTLHQNQFLLQNHSLSNGNALLYMDNSCNLILYNGHDKVWATNTSGEAKHSCWAQLEKDGNFVVYGDNDQLWDSGSGGVVGHYELVLLDSGNIAIFASCPVIWSPDIRKKAVREDDIKPTWSPEIGKKYKVDLDHKPI